MHPLKLSRVLVATLPLVGLGWGCSLLDSAQADKVFAATLLATPSYDLKPLLPDAGGYVLPFDAGAPPTAIPAQTMAQVFFGQRNTDPSKEPQGIAGATVKLTYQGKSFTLPDRGNGNYSLTSVEDGTLQYQDGKDGVLYEITVDSGGATYTAKVIGPVAEHIEQFAVLNGLPLAHTEDSALKLTRSGTENVAFTTVVPVTTSGLGDPTYTDLPTKTMDLLDLIANDSLWKQKVITLPATAFPEPGTFYAVTIAAVQRGETSSNLFTTSAFLVGKADLGLVKTK